ncbi:hypothetical protein [Leptolyngbya sp. 7M]|uniref:hypothetical protein n=1 Tax=Leptolyngbya sp. 7M TaxID=2812896 RepID=UPI001B8B14FA|nr:hypothetical protein [Leptolyngbya sp. 7M]QYO62484.1 hypothetical protein JVX88_20675 [Leptolyngbya sp. 7M]
MMHEDGLEGLPMGILILNVEGALILANSDAQQICQQLLAIDLDEANLPSPVDQFPQPIHRIVEAVLESRELFPDQGVIIEDTVFLPPATIIHLRGRWLDLDIESYILVMLEAQSQPENNPEPVAAPGWHRTQW